MRDGPRPPLLVLVVDDSRDCAESLALLVRLWGHQAVVAYDGPAALEAARSRAPDVVLLDIAMPKMDGYELVDPDRSHATNSGACLANHCRIL
jgi:CheY-like chemotaxis protein